MKGSFTDVVKFTRPKPVTLIIAHEESTLVVEAQPIGRANSRSVRSRLALRVNFHDPTTVGDTAVHASHIFLNEFFIVISCDIFFLYIVTKELSAGFGENTAIIGSDIKSNIEVSLGVANGSKGKFVIIAREAKIIVELHVGIGATIFI